MALKDMEKTTFLTMWGTFCYKVMPFGQKNVVATYQRAIVTLFHDIMHKEIEVYVDDMIAKSQGEDDHVIVDALFCPGYLFRFNFCWTLGPLMSRFKFGP